VSDCRFAATEGGWAVSGALVMASAAAAYREGLRLRRQCAGRVVDLSALQSIDSAGIAVLLAWIADARQHGEGLRVVGLSTAGQALARVGGVLDLLVPPAG
jgi:phospholipid transport system transporter-binding protein